jgi:hypothetical protein
MVKPFRHIPSRQRVLAIGRSPTRNTPTSPGTGEAGVDHHSRRGDAAHDGGACQVIYSSNLTTCTAAVEKHDAFVGVSAGLNIEQALANDYTLLAGLSADKHNNFTQDDFDTGSLEAILGLPRNQGAIPGRCAAKPTCSSSTTLRSAPSTVTRSAAPCNGATISTRATKLPPTCSTAD